MGIAKTIVTTGVLALVLAVMMFAAMAVPAMADDPAPATGKTITLTGGKAGHTYTLYQIFTGTIDATSTTTPKTLTNVQWGNGVTDTFQATKTTAAAYAKEIATANDARATAQALRDANALTNGTAKELTADGDVVFNGLAEGYYVIVDTVTGTVATEGDYYSALIVEVVEDVNGALKGSGASSEKKVQDKNDSTSADPETVGEGTSATTWQDSADYDIDDAVPFQLTATMADNVAAYKKYHITFQDKQSAGLNNPSTFSISVLGQTISLAYNAAEAQTATATYGEGTDAVTVNIKAEMVTPDSGNTFAINVSFANAASGKLLPANLNSQKIIVTYSSVLNSNAKVGSQGNPNESYIKYSNNPESTDDSEEGKTPGDKVTVFTYNLKVDKTDESSNALKGAGFTLYKYNAASTETDKYEAVGSEVSGADLTTFVWTGLDDGKYKLVETKVPDGFNKAEDITFDVVAAHDANNADPALKSLTVENITPATTTISANKDATGAVDTYVQATSFDASATYYTESEGTYTEATVANEEAFNAGTFYIKQTNISANLATTVINKSGAVLPETGGIGTTIFYVAGSILVLAAAILLITKRRMGAQD